MSTSEATILARVIGVDEGLSPEAAHWILRWKFPQHDVERMTQLSEKASSGTLTDAEQEELNDHERVGHFIGIAQSWARMSLKGAISGS